MAISIVSNMIVLQARPFLRDSPAVLGVHWGEKYGGLRIDQAKRLLTPNFSDSQIQVSSISIGRFSP